ncbi:MAG: hypothetical protein HZB29_10600 [Nitrospinae bacterium]|nr:hypothetical protein [Nitrospinota bacterium]
MKACPHLRPLVGLLRRRDAPVAARHRNWTGDAGYKGRSIYYDVAFKASLRDEAGLSPDVRYQVFGVTAQYAGFFCDSCSSLAAGINPGYDPKTVPAFTPFA